MRSKYIQIIVFLSLFLLPVLCNLAKHSASSILTILALLGLHAWITEKKPYGFSSLEKYILCSFALYFFISLFFYLANGFFRESASLKWNLDHEIRFFAFIPIYFLFRKIKLKEWPLWYGSGIAAILCGLFSLYCFLNTCLSADSSSIHHSLAFIENTRVTGAYNPIAFGQLSLAFGFMSLTGIRYFQKIHPALILLPVFSLAGGILAGFFSGTRGVIITIPFLTLIFFIQSGTFKFPWRWRIALIMSTLFLSAGLYSMPGSAMAQRFHTGIRQAKAFFNGKGTGHYVVRLGMWSEALKIIKENPVCGTGKDGYKQIIEMKASKNEIPESIQKFDSPHNNYLSNMTAYGISGLFMLLAIFLFPLFFMFSAIKKHSLQSDMAYGGIMLIVSFMIFAMTETLFYRNINISIYVIMTAAILNLVNASRRPDSQQ